MQAAVIADELGKQEERDRNLNRVVTAGLRAKPKEAQGLYGRLGALMKTALPPGSMKDFDFEKLDVILRESKTKAWSVETNLAYFAGMFLKNRGNAEKARVYLVRAAETAQYHVANQTLACRQLRQMKIPFVPLRGEKAHSSAAPNRELRTGQPCDRSQLTGPPRIPPEAGSVPLAILNRQATTTLSTTK